MDQRKIDEALSGRAHDEKCSLCTAVKWFVAIGAVVLLFAVLATAAEAGHILQCGPHDRIVNRLSEKYQEARKATGTVNDNQVMEIFVSKSGTWTVLSISPDGAACVVAAGKNWRDVPWEPGTPS